MWQTQIGTPVSSANGQNAQLGDDDSGTNSSCDFLGCLDTETDVTFGITDNDDGLESGSLTGTSLLLDWLDLLEEGISICPIETSSPNLHPQNPQSTHSPPISLSNHPSPPKKPNIPS